MIAVIIEYGLEDAHVEKKLNGFLNKYGKRLCAMATIIASYGVLSCRGIFFQPKEPDDLKNLIGKEE